MGVLADQDAGLPPAGVMVSRPSFRYPDHRCRGATASPGESWQRREVDVRMQGSCSLRVLKAIGGGRALPVIGPIVVSSWPATVGIGHGKVSVRPPTRNP